MLAVSFNWHNSTLSEPGPVQYDNSPNEWCGVDIVDAAHHREARLNKRNGNDWVLLERLTGHDAPSDSVINGIYFRFNHVANRFGLGDYRCTGARMPHTRITPRL